MKFFLSDQDQKAQRLFLCGAFAILTIWGLCYFPNLRASPGWYGDEFISLMEGNSILSGTFNNRALKYSFFSTFTNYQPWGAALYSLAARVFSSGDIVGARGLSILLCLILVMLVYVEFFKRKMPWVGFCTALTILLAPQCTIHFRWVYPHYFVSLGVVLIGLLLSRDKKESSDDWALGVGCALAAAGHLLAVHVMAATCLSQIRRPKAWIKIILPSAILLGIALALGYWSSGYYLFLDLQELAGGYLGDSNRSTPLEKLVNIYRYFFTDWFHVLLFSSYFCLMFLRKWALFTFSASLSFLIIQNRPELPIFYYQSMVFVPLLCVNLMLCLRGIGQKASGALKSQVPNLCMQSLSLLIPLVFLFPALRNSMLGSHQPRNQYWVAPRHSDLEEATKWVNRNTGPQDLVVAFWDVGWMLRCRWTDPMQCAIWSYGNFPYFYNRSRSHSEFIFAANLAEARYLIVGPLDMRWLYGQGTIPILLKDFHIETWPTVFQTETTRVLANPTFQN